MLLLLPSFPSRALSSTITPPLSLSTLTIAPTHRRVGRPEFDPESLTNQTGSRPPPCQTRLAVTALYVAPPDECERRSSSGGNDRLERENVREQESVGPETKAEGGPRPSPRHRHGRESAARHDANKRSEEEETATIRLLFSSCNNPVRAPAPMPADNPKCPPSAPSKRKTSNSHPARIRSDP